MDEHYLPEHGGDVASASEYYGIAPHRWIDLSTGINPYAYPVREIPGQVFERLPYGVEAFQAQIQSYFETEHVLAVNGLESLIYALPQVLPSLPWLLPEVGYKSYTKACMNHEIPFSTYPSLFLAGVLGGIDRELQRNSKQHLFIINPNNPTGVRLHPNQIRNWASQLTGGGCLIVDEAFIDLTPEHSMLNDPLPENVLVLRSFGKFFGLAGLRLGFVIAKEEILDRLRKKIGAWPINGVAQHIAAQAYADETWMAKTKTSLQEALPFHQAFFERITEKMDVRHRVHTLLFSSYVMPTHQAMHLLSQAGRNGVLLRYFPLTAGQGLIRFGRAKCLTFEQKKLFERRMLRIQHQILQPHSPPLPA